MGDASGIWADGDGEPMITFRHTGKVDRVGNEVFGYRAIRLDESRMEFRPCDNRLLLPFDVVFSGQYQDRDGVWRDTKFFLTELAEDYENGFIRTSNNEEPIR